MTICIAMTVYIAMTIYIVMTVLLRHCEEQRDAAIFIGEACTLKKQRALAHVAHQWLTK